MVEDNKTSEKVNHPKHYNFGKYEVIDVVEDWQLGFNLGNSIKYIGRADHKGNKLEDLRKARWYLDREIRNIDKTKYHNHTHNIEEEYLCAVMGILSDGTYMQNRTGVPTNKIPCITLQHNLENGFPLLTTKKMPFKIMATELEGFIKGITDKKWFQDRNCHIWDDWCSPEKVVYGIDEESKKKMLAERDLGYIYGYQWRNFNSAGFDQFKTIIDTLKKDKTNRRLVCSAWNPQQISKMALPPCHVLWHIIVTGNKLNLCWFQRSCDMMLGVPFNIASYALLTCLIAKEVGLEPSLLTGFLSDAHIYENHFANAEIQVQRNVKLFPELKFKKWTNIYEWEATDCELLNYNPDEKIEYTINV